MRAFIITCLLIPFAGFGQELYVYAEPASNMPAKSFALKLNNRFQRNTEGSVGSRQQVEAMYGFSNKLMVHVGGSSSNYFSSNYRPEAAWVYSKYRFFSQDGLKTHLRLAAYGEFGYSRNPWMFEEIDVTGDQTGFQAGGIATYLKNKTAVSATLGYARQGSTMMPHHHHETTDFRRDGFVWNASVGQLLLPKTYESYDQPNLNIYLTAMGQHNAAGRYFVDLAPALQLILKSSLKLNLGYRAQVSGNMDRMARQSVQVSAEYTWLR